MKKSIIVGVIALMYILSKEVPRMNARKRLIFLGGTVANNKWRADFIPALLRRGYNMEDIFNPVVEDWTEDDAKKEEAAKKAATHLVFYIGSPQQDGNPLSAYSMVEATMALYDRQLDTVVVFDPVGIEGHALKSYKQTEKVLRARFPKANIFSTIDEALNWFARQLT